MSVYTQIMHGRDSHTRLRKCAEVAGVCTCFNLRKAARAVTQLFDQVLEPSGLRATQVTLLVAIALASSATVGRLAERLVMDRTTLTRNLAPLAREGLIESASGKDRRTRTVRLTGRGEAALARALPLWARVQARVVQGLGEKRWRSLLADLSETVALARPS